MAFQEKDDLDWRVLATYGLAMSYVQEFEWSLIQTIAHYRRDLGTFSEQWRELWEVSAGRLLARLEGRLPASVFKGLQLLVDNRNWLAHDFFREGYNLRRRGDEDRAREAVQRLDRLAQEFKDASMGLLALRTRITPPMDGEEKMRAVWASDGPTLSVKGLAAPSDRAGR